MGLLEKIQSEWKIDSDLNTSDLDNETRRIGILHGKYLEYYNTAKLHNLRLQEQYSKLLRNKWRWYRGEMSKQEIEALGWAYDPYNGCTKPLKAEIKEFYIDCDPDIIKFHHMIEYNNQCIDSAKSILDIVKWRHQQIRNIIEFRKLVSGN